jgi:hypothetical protein
LIWHAIVRGPVQEFSYSFALLGDQREHAMPLPRRGQIQLRGMLRWRLRRWLVRWRSSGVVLEGLPIVFGNAIPKAGSTLLFNILRGLPKIGPFVDTGLNEIKPYFRGAQTSQVWIRKQLNALRPGDVRFGYLYATEENIELLCQPGRVGYLILRDPRDVVLSEVFYALQINPDHLLHDHLAAQPDIESRINTIIRGIPEGPLKRVNVKDHYRRFLPWLRRNEFHEVRFETLIGEPRLTLIAMLEHLMGRGFELGIPYEQAVDLLQEQMAPEKSLTYRKGQPGEWRQFFSEQNKHVFKEIAGDLLVQLGYETDMTW